MTEQQAFQYTLNRLARLENPPKDILPLDKTTITQVLETQDNEGTYTIQGLFIGFEPVSRRWTAIDNSNGDAWTEDFNKLDTAISYLHGADLDECRAND